MALAAPPSDPHDVGRFPGGRQMWPQAIRKPRPRQPSRTPVPGTDTPENGPQLEQPVGSISPRDEALPPGGEEAAADATPDLNRPELLSGDCLVRNSALDLGMPTSGATACLASACSNIMQLRGHRRRTSAFAPAAGSEIWRALGSWTRALQVPAPVCPSSPSALNERSHCGPEPESPGGRSPAASGLKDTAATPQLDAASTHSSHESSNAVSKVDIAADKLSGPCIVVNDDDPADAAWQQTAFEARNASLEQMAQSFRLLPHSPERSRALELLNEIESCFRSQNPGSWQPLMEEVVGLIQRIQLAASKDQANAGASGEAVVEPNKATEDEDKPPAAAQKVAVRSRAAHLSLNQVAPEAPVVDVVDVVDTLSSDEDDSAPNTPLKTKGTASTPATPGTSWDPPSPPMRPMPATPSMSDKLSASTGVTPGAETASLSGAEKSAVASAPGSTPKKDAGPRTGKLPYSVYCREVAEHGRRRPAPSLQQLDAPPTPAGLNASASTPPTSHPALSPSVLTPNSKPQPVAQTPLKRSATEVPGSPPKKGRVQQVHSSPATPAAQAHSRGVAVHAQEAQRVTKFSDGDGEDEDTLPLSTLLEEPVRILESEAAGEQWPVAMDMAKPAVTVTSPRLRPDFQWQIWEESKATITIPQGPRGSERPPDGPRTELLWSSSLFATHLRHWLRSVRVPAGLS